MPRLAPAFVTLAPADKLFCRPGFVERLRRHLSRTDLALEGQRHLSALSPDILRDTCLAPEDLTGASTHDPALPFFLQSGFGRRDR